MDPRHLLQETAKAHLISQGEGWIFFLEDIYERLERLESDHGYGHNGTGHAEGLSDVQCEREGCIVVLTKKQAKAGTRFCSPRCAALSTKPWKHRMTVIAGEGVQSKVG